MSKGNENSKEKKKKKKITNLGEVRHGFEQK